MQHYGEFVNCCLINDEEERAARRVCHAKFDAVSVTIRVQHNFSDEAIDELQLILDDFFMFWIDLVGRDGITNYLHMLGAGHFRFFFRRWRNLYQYANQGWEHYNASIKSFFHK